MLWPAGRSGLATVGGSVVDDPEDPIGVSIGFGGHDLLDQSAERYDAGGGLAAAEDLGAVDVVGGQVGERAAAVVVVVDPHRRDWPGARVGWQRHRAWMEVFSSAEIT